MAGGKKILISPDIKAAILARVRLGKKSLTDPAESEVGRITIGYWLEREVKVAPATPLTELVQLRKENAELYQLIGKLTLEMDRGKERSE